MEARTRVLVDIGKRLSEARSRCRPKPSIAALAKKLKEKADDDAVTDDTIGAWEKGEQEAGIYGLALLAQELQVSLDWIVFGDDKFLVDQEAMEEIERLGSITDDGERGRQILDKLDDDPQPVRVAVETIRKVKVCSRRERREAEVKLATFLAKHAGPLMKAWGVLMESWKKELTAAQK